MAKAKKKQLPEDFEALLEKGDLSELKLLFDTHDRDARAGFSKQTALAFDRCPDEMARWLVEHGADLGAADTYGDTPLHTRSRGRRGRIEVLLELGADVNHGDGVHGTPLHAAAGSYSNPSAATLLRHGARVDALNRQGQTPLTYALQSCSNAQIGDMAELAELLLAAGARRTAEMKEFVARIGTNFEFFRAGFNPDSVEATSAALDKLYVLFDVPAAPRRHMHDGKSPIVARGARWQDQHRELWDLLVPSKGTADTVQGEVIRISGRIHDELERNGGGNWDATYKRMANAFLMHVASGVPLADALLAEARRAVAEAKQKSGNPLRLCEFAVNWVAQNPRPMKLPSPIYDR